MKRLISSMLIVCLLLSMAAVATVSAGAASCRPTSGGAEVIASGYDPTPTECPTEPEPTEAPTEPPTESYYCNHWYTYTQNENYHYYSGYCTYDVVTYCSNCGQELYRDYGSEEYYSEPTEATYSGGSGTIYFDAASAGWENASSILFYISDLEYGELAAWGSKKKLGGTKVGNNIWAFDAAGLGVTAGHTYFIIFNNYDTTAETYQLLMDTSCFGDTAYVNRYKLIENPFDSNKASMEARWTNSRLGPRLQISSICNLVGEMIPANTTAYQMMVDFLASKGSQSLSNALNYNHKDAQTIIDDTAKGLGLTRDDVARAINEAATTGNQYGDKTDWSRQWDYNKSTLPGGGNSSGNSGSSSSSSSSGTSSGSAYTSYPRVAVKSASDGLEISWTRVYGANWYRVFYKGRNGWTKLTDTTGNAVIDTDVRSGKTYTYTVRALSNDRKVYTSDYERNGVAGTYIAPPVFSVSNAEDGVRIKWSAVPGAAQYRVFYNSRNGWKKLTDTTSTSVIDADVRSGATYTYTVRCLSKDGKSYTSDFLDGRSVTFLTAPKFNVANATDGVRISWSAVPGAAKYRVFYITRNGWKKLTDTTSTSVLDTVVRSGATYTYTVRSLSKDGKSYTSDFRSGKSIRFTP